MHEESQQVTVVHTQLLLNSMTPSNTACFMCKCIAVICMEVLNSPWLHCTYCKINMVMEDQAEQGERKGCGNNICTISRACGACSHSNIIIHNSEITYVHFKVVVNVV